MLLITRSVVVCFVSAFSLFLLLPFARLCVVGKQHILWSALFQNEAPQDTYMGTGLVFVLKYTFNRPLVQGPGATRTTALRRTLEVSNLACEEETGIGGVGCGEGVERKTRKEEL